MSNVGPASRMELDFGSRLNLLTGDNGLGKSFLLDIIWWSMTRKWPTEVNPHLTAGRIALPTDKKKPASISALFSAVSRAMEYNSSFNARMQNWTIKQGRPANPGLIFYAMADGSFAVWDPARNYWKSKGEEGNSRPAAYVFNPSEVWDGLQNADGAWLCNGLIRDWASWQKENGTAFASLKSVLDVLSPSEEERLIPGRLTRVSLDDARDIPTLKMPYGQEVPVLHASSGMRRIISLAYFLVWCWDEHLKAKELLGEEVETRAVFLVDEVEAHLHPKWQRTVIPALMKVMGTLSASEQVQLIVATHSPLIMASVETLFSNKEDAWFDLDLTDSMVTLTKRPFIRMGNVSNWLTSKAFDLKQGYSKEAEQVLEAASLALSDEAFNPDAARRLDQQLRSVLSETDPFWIRWRFVAKKKGWMQ
ncbi:MAG: AAA family ATPase [Mailhella sp.]|nr:AAA family ATPase [Mailhella sp.]